mgnify:CR=1 FL=1
MYEDAIYTPEYWEEMIDRREANKGVNSRKSRNEENNREADCWTCRYFKNWNCLADELNVPEHNRNICPQYDVR